MQPLIQHNFSQIIDSCLNFPKRICDFLVLQIVYPSFLFYRKRNRRKKTWYKAFKTFIGAKSDPRGAVEEEEEEEETIVLKKSTYFLHDIYNFTNRKKTVQFDYDYHENEEGFLQRWLDWFLHKIGYLQFDDIHDQTDEEHEDIEEEESFEDDEVEHEDESYAGAVPGSYVKIPSDSFVDGQYQYESFENSKSFETTEGM